MEKENQITEIWFSFSILVFPLSNFISFSSTFLNPESFHYSVVELLQVASLSPFDTKVTKNCKYLCDPHTSMVESKFEFCLWTYLLKLVKKKRRRKRTAAEIITIVLAAYEKLTSNLSICQPVWSSTHSCVKTLEIDDLPGVRMTTLNAQFTGDKLPS